MVRSGFISKYPIKVLGHCSLSCLVEAFVILEVERSILVFCKSSALDRFSDLVFGGKGLSFFFKLNVPGILIGNSQFRTIKSIGSFCYGMWPILGFHRMGILLVARVWYILHEVVTLNHIGKEICY